MVGKFFHYKPYGWHGAISHNSTAVCYPVGTYNLTHYSILVIYQNNNLNKSWKFCYTSFLLLYTSQAYWIFVKNLVETEIVGHVEGAYMSCENLWRRGRCLSRFGKGWSPHAVAAGGDAPGSPDQLSRCLVWGCASGGATWSGATRGDLKDRFWLQGLVLCVLVFLFVYQMCL